MQACAGRLRRSPHLPTANSPTRSRAPRVPTSQPVPQRVAQGRTRAREDVRGARASPPPPPAAPLPPPAPAPAPPPPPSWAGTAGDRALKQRNLDHKKVFKGHASQL